VCALCEDGQETTFGNECDLNRQNTCEPSNREYFPVMVSSTGTHFRGADSVCFLLQPKECTKLRDGDCAQRGIPPGSNSLEPRPAGPRPSHRHPSFEPCPLQTSPRTSYPKHPNPNSFDQDPSISGHYIPAPYRPRAPGPRSTCPVACPAVYQPVCADCQETGETTFENICDLEAANACNPHNRK